MHTHAALFYILKVVIKILRISHSPTNGDFRAKLTQVSDRSGGTSNGYRHQFQHLRREMKVWANLNHPNIVPLLGHTAEGEGPALISPFYENGSVIDYLATHSSQDRYIIVCVQAYCSQAYSSCSLTSSIVRRCVRWSIISSLSQPSYHPWRYQRSITTLNLFILGCHLISPTLG